MNYDEFLNKLLLIVKAHYCDYFESDLCIVDINKITKNNGITYDALTIFDGDSIVSPNILIRPLYDKYLFGCPLDLIADIVLKEYCKEKEQYKYEGFDIKDFSSLKGSILPYLVNRKLNSEMLEGIPYRAFLDLAIIYKIIVAENTDGVSVVTVTNKELEYWEVTEGDLFDLANNNYSKRYEWFLKPLSDYVLSSSDSIPDNYIDELKEIFDYNKIGLYLLTNQKYSNGAIYLTNREILTNFSRVHNCGFYVLPSSIHEIILVLERDDTDIEFLKQLLNDANETAVGYIDFLSNNVYYYDPEVDNLVIVE